nr:MAG TPA: hypothetical protein [Caudoviricetes sp.]
MTCKDSIFLLYSIEFYRYSNQSRVEINGHS